MTRRLAVIGFPLGHTLSPAIHLAAIRAQGLDLTYDAVEIAPPRLASFLEDLHGPEWLGVNVTVPHKQAVLAALASLSEEASAIGAVNTIVNRQGQLCGFNTDAPAFLADVQERCGPVDGKCVTVLGAGGAARAVCFALKDRAAMVWVLNRTEDRAEALVTQLGGRLRIGGREALRDCELIVNCTSAGLKPEASPIPHEWLPAGVQLYDLIYNPPVTGLMRATEQRGGRAANGLGMLVRQAAMALEIWTGRRPPLEVMFQAASDAIGERAHA